MKRVADESDTIDLSAILGENLTGGMVLDKLGYETE